MKKSIKIAFALVMAVMLLLTGCATTTTPSASPSAAASASAKASPSAAASASSSAPATVDMSKVTLRVQYTYPPDSKLLELAGVGQTPYKLELISYTGSNLALNAIAADSLDLARSSEIPPLYAALTNGGGNFSIIANEKMYMGYQALVIGPKSTIKSVADLKGQKVGYVAQTSSQFFLEKMLEQAGLAWKDIQAVNLTPADGASSLAGGSIVAMASYGNPVIANTKLGGSTLQDATSILSGNTFWCANNKSLKDPAVAAAMVDYLQRTEKLEAWIRANHDKYAAVMADKYYGMTVPDFVAYLTAGEKVRENHVFAYTDADIKALQDVSDTMFKIGAIEKQVDVKPLFNNTLSAAVTTAMKAAK